jgi:hypothetical protein
MSRVKLWAAALSTHFNSIRLAVYIDSDSKEHKGQRLEQWPWLASCHAEVKHRGGVSCFVLWKKLKMAYCMYGFSRNALNCKLLSTQVAGIKHLYTLHDVKEITIVQPWQNSIKNSVFWSGVEYHRQVAEIPLHKYKLQCRSVHCTVSYSVSYRIIFRRRCAQPAHLLLREKSGV